MPLLPQYAREGTAVQFTVVAADVDGDPLLYSLHQSARRRHAQRHRRACSPGRPPTARRATTPCTSWPPTRRARRATMDVVLDVAHVVRPPVLDTPNHQATLGMPLRFPIQATDLDAGTTLTYSAINLPAGATINPTDRRSSPGRPARRRPATTSSRCRSPTARRPRRRTSSSVASVQPQLPSVTIVLTPSFPAIPGQQVDDQRHRRQRGADRQPDGHRRRPAADAQRQRPGHGHRRHAGPDAHPGDRDRRRTACVGTATAELMVRDPQRHDGAGRLVRQLGPLRRAHQPDGHPRHGLPTATSTRGPWRSPRRRTPTSRCWRPARRR